MPELDFQLKTEYIELFKLLKLTGLCESGGQAKYVISQGLVRVDGNPETRKAFKVRAGQCIELEGETIRVKAG